MLTEIKHLKCFTPSEMKYVGPYLHATHMENPTFCRSGNVQRYVPDPRPHVGEKPV